MLCFCRVNVSSSPVLPIQSPGNVSDSTEVNIDSVKVEILWQRVTYSLDLLRCFTLVCVFLLSRRVLKWLSAYQNLQVTAVLEFTQCTIGIATLRLRPDHRSTSTDQVRSSLRSSNISSFFFCKYINPHSSHLFSVLPPFLYLHDSSSSSSFHFFHYTTKGWCFLPLYSLATMTPAPLPLYAITFFPPPKVGSPAPLPHFSALLLHSFPFVIFLKFFMKKM